MGCFGYICKGCRTPINGDCFIGGEKCVLIHFRHGKEIGRVEGHYDEYGRVIEQEGWPETERYRGYGDGINGHSAICDSEFSLTDSFLRLRELRIYNEREMDYFQFIVAIKLELREAHGFDEAERIWETLESDGTLERNFATLPIPVREQYSGTVAWHSKCYAQASPEAQADLTPSDTDPDQSWRRIRNRYK